MSSVALLAALGVALTAALAGWLHGRHDPLARAEAACAAGQWQPALRGALSRLHSHPDDPRALLVAARSFAHLGYGADAERCFGRLSGRLSPGDLRLRAGALVQAGRWSDAVAAYRSLLDEDPHDAVAQRSLAAILVRQHTDLDEAMRWARALQAQPSPQHATEGHLLLADTYHLLHWPARAADEFRAALELDPDLTSAGPAAALAREDLTADLMTLGRIAEAESQLQSVATLERGWAWHWVASACRLEHDDAVGFDRLRARAFEIDPGSAGPRRPPETAVYVGARRCAECHQDVAERQSSSGHANTFRIASPDFLAGLLGAPQPDPREPSVEHFWRLRRADRGEDYSCWVVRRGEETAEARVGYAFGSGRHGLTLIGWDGAGRPCELPLSYYGSDGWALTPGHSRPQGEHAAEYLGRRLGSETLQGCFDCHTTGPWPGAPPSLLDLDAGVSCEACHGPGGNHVRAVALGAADRALIHPGGLAADALTDLCARCHIAAATGPAAPGHTGLSQPEMFSTSRCYAASGGALRCTTCHDPHEDAETDVAYYTGKCLTCHDASAGQTACRVEPASRCVVCHMPALPGLVHTRVTDHSILARPR